MGVLSTTIITTMRTAFLFLATLAIAAAFTPSNSVIFGEDVSPEEEFLSFSESSPDVSTQDREDMFAEHQVYVDNLLQQKAGKANSCIDTAKKSIESVFHTVKNAQGVLNRMDNGKHCTNKGQNLIKAANASLQRKQAAEKQARKNFNAAQNARITVVVTFSSGQRSCSVFKKSAQWRKAQRNKTRKQNELTKAQQQVRDAKKYLAKMHDKARQDRCKCKARVENAAQGAATQARKLTADRKKSIVRELMLICIVKARSKKTAAARNNAGQACKSQGFPSKYNAKLALHKTKLVAMNFKCKRCGNVYCTAHKYEKYHKERVNKERSSKERTNKERAQKAAANRERAQKERNTKERARKRNSWKGKSWVSAYGYGWRTLGGGAYNGPQRYCDSSWKQIPKGCQVAPDNWQSRTMAKRYCWSTAVVVFSNGNSWGTSCYGSNHWNYGMLSRSGRNAKTNNCSLMVMLRCNL